MRNRYVILKLKILGLMLKKRKITFKKLINALCCFCSYFLKLKKSGRLPLMVSLELTNECNANCLFCRNADGKIHDSNPNGTEEGILKGKMPFEMCIDILKQVKNHILVAVLYTNGEPLLHQDLTGIVRFAKENNVATIVATNGLLLNEKKISQLLESGLDCIKIALSGYTQEFYSVQVRNGNVEKVKENIRTFVHKNKEGKHGCIIMVDYMLYNYNMHQLEPIRKFCKELGVMLNIRQGNPAGGLEDKEPALIGSSSLPLKKSCNWLWLAMQINWNGDVLPCCESVVWSGIKPFEKFKTGKTSIKDIWNGEYAMAMRQAIAEKGRRAFPICSACMRHGIEFKW